MNNISNYKLYVTELCISTEEERWSYSKKKITGNPKISQKTIKYCTKK